MLLTACASTVWPDDDSYKVRRGDTLYSIAWDHDVDWRKLARWNDIGPPYTIYPGQTLSLDPPSGTDRAEPASTESPKQTVENDRTSRPKPKPKATEKRPEPETDQRGRTTPARADGPWQWPVQGSLLQGFERSRPRKGIEIGGEPGAPVAAANGGRVVYSGDGLKGYGRLVIIKHNERYLSAYGFNRKLLVAQGEGVEAGQRIAEMGRGPGNRPMLYFEIRRDGRPIDPEGVLP